METVVTRHNLSQKLAVCSEKLARIHEQVRTKEDLIESVLGGRSSVVVLPPIPGTKAAPEPLAIQQRDEGSDSEDTLFGDREAVKRRWEEIREAQKGSSESRGGGGFSLGKAIFSGPRMKE